jgi:hypothetical protein
LIELAVLGSLARYGKQEMRRQGDEEIKETSLSPELFISCDPHAAVGQNGGDGLSA